MAMLPINNANPWLLGGAFPSQKEQQLTGLLGGQPNQRLSGLLGDPLFNAGIAMLQNQGPHLSDALGAGFQGLQGGLQYQQDMKRQQEQDALNARYREAQIASLTAPKTPTPTDDEREYERAVSQGYKGTFFDYMRDMKAAGRTETTVNIPAGEKAFDSELGKKLAGQYMDIQTGAGQARNKIATLNALQNALADTGYTGPGGGKVLELRRLGNAMGLDLGDTAAGETAQAIGNQLALQLRNPSGGAGMPGAMSDKDREFLQKSVPGLLKTPGGNARLVDYLKRIEQRNIEVADLANRYVMQNGRLDAGFYTVLNDYAAQNPLFPETLDQPPTLQSSQPNSDGWSIQKIE